MIIREIKQIPEQVLKTFDYFNDYNDTHLWLSIEIKYEKNPALFHKMRETLKKLEAGHEEFCKNFFKNRVT